MKKDQKSRGYRINTHATQDKQFCRRLLPALIAGCFSYHCASANPNPNTAVVANGIVSFQVSNQGNGVGNMLTITNTPRAIINWSSFSIPTGQTTRFIQQSANSNVLNRVTGTTSSSVAGTLQSGMLQNCTFVPGFGTIYLINPNGIVFGAKSQINVGGIVASTIGITNQNFINGINQFDKAINPNPTIAGSISNQGKITTPSGGKIYLIAPNVTNSGILKAPNGQILLAAGNKVTLVDSNFPDLQVMVSAPGENAVNLGSIEALSGKVGIYGALLNLTGGTINANTAATGPNGEVVLKAVQNVNLGSGVSVDKGTLTLKSDTGNITQSAAINVGQLSAEATTGSVTLTNAANTAGTISGVAGGSGGFNHQSSGNINVGNVKSLSGITSNGPITLTSTGGNITTNSGAIITGPALTAAAFSGVGSQQNPLNTAVSVLSISNGGSGTGGGDIAVQNGAKPLTINGITENNGGSIFVDNSQAPLTVAGTINTANGDIGLKTLGSMSINAPVSAANGTVALQANGNVTQTQGPITASKFSVRSINGSVALNDTNNNIGTANGIASPTGTFSLKNSGDYIVGDIPLVGPYYSGGYFIDKLGLITLTISGETVQNKVYDGTTVATILGGRVTAPSAYSGYNITLNKNNGTFATKNVVTDIAVTANDKVTAPFLFKLNQQTGLKGDITAKQLTVSGTTAANKVYDGNTMALLSGGSLNGVIQGESVGLTQTGNFASRNVGTHLAVTAADTLTGDDAKNYYLIQPTGLFADITAKQLSIISTMAMNKVYDGTTTAPLTNGSLVGLINGDYVTLSQTGNFADKNVGVNRPVTVTSNLAGGDAGNYSLVQTSPLFADITAKQLSIIGTMAMNKVYDGTATAPLTSGSLVGLISGDSVALHQTGTFADKNVGVNLPVTITSALTGGDAGNYTIGSVLAPTSDGFFASILPASVSFGPLPEPRYINDLNNLFKNKSKEGIKNDIDDQNSCN